MRIISKNDRSPRFSTKEAAEKWIAEQNARKEIIVSANSKYPIKVTKDKVTILCANSTNHSDNIVISVRELDEVTSAFGSLQ